MNIIDTFAASNRLATQQGDQHNPFTSLKNATCGVLGIPPHMVDNEAFEFQVRGNLSKLQDLMPEDVESNDLYLEDLYLENVGPEIF